MRIKASAAKAALAAAGIELPKREARKRRAAGLAAMETGKNERLFAIACRAQGLPFPVSEYQFAPPRKWRFDHCWAEAMVALEVQGGTFMEGRHSRGASLRKEYEKLNTAAILGWRILFALPEQLNDGSIFPLLKQAIYGDEA